MALRDQPYLPLYIQDFLTDEKLSECSAASNGVYIRIMCIMHKQETYGTILLKQKHKQTDNQIKNFASFLLKSLPYDLLTIETSLIELLEEKVLLIDGDFLIQKRMVKDGKISDSRALNGKKGGEKTQSTITDFAKANSKAKDEANSEYENDNVIDIRIIEIVNFLNEKTKSNFSSETKQTVKLISARLKKYTQTDFETVILGRVLKWSKDEKMKQYLTPSTLFAESNFEKYLLEAAPPKKANVKSIADQMEDMRNG